MDKELENLKTSLTEALKSATKEADVLNIKSEYVGKKSRISELLTNLKDMSVDDKRKYGSLINNTKKEMENIVNDYLLSLESKSISSSNNNCC